jgi:hypothetical protein
LPARAGKAHVGVEDALDEAAVEAARDYGHVPAIKADREDNRDTAGDDPLRA